MPWRAFTGVGVARYLSCKARRAEEDSLFVICYSLSVICYSFARAAGPVIAGARSHAPGFEARSMQTSRSFAERQPFSEVNSARYWSQFGRL